MCPYMAAGTKKSEAEMGSIATRQGTEDGIGEGEAEMGHYYRTVDGEKLILCSGGLPTCMRRTEKMVSTPRA